MPKITFTNNNLTAEVPDESTILDAALEKGREIEHDCGGNGVCGTCHVIIIDGMENLSARDGDEEDLLRDVEALADNARLACQAHIFGDITVTIPES